MVLFYQSVQPITTLHDAGIQTVTALSFDPVSDSLWAGVDSGIVIALHTAQGLRGVSFPVGGGLAVKQVTVGDNYVRAFGLAGEGLGSWAKGGMNKWYFRPKSALTAASSSTFTPNLLATASSSPELALLNASTGSTVRQVPVSSIITHLQYSLSNLLSASIDGHVRVHDPRSGIRRENGEASVQAHSSGVQDLQVTGNFFFTIGRSLRRGHEFPDPLVKVYDLRSMRPLPPIPFSEGPSFINLLPKHSSSLVVTSAQGLVNVVDVSDATNASGFYQVGNGLLLRLNYSGSFIGFGDAAGAIHLLTAADESSELYFNGFEGQPIEHADVPEPLPDITWTDSTPLNSIGMPYYNTLLLSSWTPRFVSHGLHYPPPSKIPPQVLSTMKVNENIAYAALPKELRGRRNRAQVTNAKDQGRFRSGKNRRDDIDLETLSIDDSVEEVPRMYRKVEIEYSKFGVEDFDFGFYNKTQYSGLETHILNSYTNPILQVMHYMFPIRKLAKSHTTTNCPREHCLLCELGFVVCMLDDARGTNCQSSNFCRVISVLAQARNQLDLIDYGREAPYDQMIQSFHRFLVDHLSLEGNSFPYNPVIYQRDPYPSGMNSLAAAPITQLLGIDAKNVVTCLNCKAVREKENMTHIIDIIYPRPMPPNEPHISSDFTSIIRNSIIREMSHKATCQTCKHFTTFVSRRSISTADLPPILAINTSIYNEESMKFWLDTRQGAFLQSQIELQGEIDGLEDPEIATYELRGPPQQPQPSKTNQENAKTKGGAFPAKPRNSTHASPSNRDKSLIKHEPLRFEELPTPGTLVAIDAEFVSMQQEEIDYRSDGTSRVLRPARLSLARVSVLRGDGPKEGVPFIDDHIHTNGDLDPHLSPFTLTPLKLVYKKLRLLVDRGCIFVGHGLSKDFRIINIYVPPERVIDTVDLYFISFRQRRLSLRFLAWYILGENIQTDTHDSIEDANSALRLYKAYQDMEEQGVFDETLEKLYREGRQYNFKPPTPTGVSTSPSKSQTPGPPTQAPSPMPKFNLSPSMSSQQQQFTRMNFHSLPDMSRFTAGHDWNKSR
ncbi:hypothetical protein PISMIDRAFT_17728 [Pisolithus microcarpus 441]|uniref:Exonuclease domain-containing protein n=1 Tax=Pisolithus microcarpus 441 TaxID=765257 RepID=A0A0C9Z1I4_9AGAM|nr:hypothetical protein PISMIDRAFT_17728 [Pisolithus microcarpus 441]